jgi:HD-GYP domain
LFTRADVQLVNAIGELVGNTLRRLLLFEQSERRLNQSQALRRIDLAILNNQSLEKTIRIALEEIRKQFRADAVAVRLKNMEGGRYALFSGLGFPAGIRTNYLEIDQNDALLKILKREKILIQPDNSMAMPSSRYLDQVRDHGFGFYAAVPFYSKKSMAGVLELFQKAPRILSEDDRDFLQMFANQMAIALENANLLKNLLNANQLLIRTYDTTIEGWSRALDMRDKETEGYTLRVTVMTLELARKMHFSEEELVHVRRGALLHDIGKMGVPDHILLKALALTERNGRS